MQVEHVHEADIHGLGPGLSLRVTFSVDFYQTPLADAFLSEVDAAYSAAGLFYFWHVGERFVDGFFEDWNAVSLGMEEIKAVALDVLAPYADKIVVAQFRERVAVGGSGSGVL